MAQNDRRSMRIGVIAGNPYTFECFNRFHCYERGLAVDITLHVCDMMRLSCTFHLRKDLDYGSRLSNGTWLGSIGDVIDGVVDTYMPVFTPTLERLQVVRFTDVFLYDNVVLMTRMPDVEEAVTMNVARVFQPHVWIALAVSLCLIWLLRLTSGRLRTGQWRFSIVKPSRARLFRGGSSRGRFDHQSSGHSTDRSRVGRWSPGTGNNSSTAEAALYGEHAPYKGRGCAGNVGQCGADDRRVKLTYVDQLTCTERWTYALEWIICLLVLSTISGVTVSSRLSAKDRLPFVDIETFTRCLETGRCRLACVSATSNYLLTLVGSDSPLSRRMARALQRYPLTIDQPEKIIPVIAERKDVYLTLMTSGRRAEYFRRLYRGDQQFHIVPTELLNTGAFPFRPQDENITETFNLISRLFRERGFDRYLYRKYGEDQVLSAEVIRRRLNRVPKAAGLHLMTDVFFTISVAWSTSVIAFIFELSALCISRCSSTIRSRFQQKL